MFCPKCMQETYLNMSLSCRVDRLSQTQYVFISFICFYSIELNTKTTITQCLIAIDLPSHSVYLIMFRLEIKQVSLSYCCLSVTGMTLRTV